MKERDMLLFRLLASYYWLFDMLRIRLYLRKVTLVWPHLKVNGSLVNLLLPRKCPPVLLVRRLLYGAHVMMDLLINYTLFLMCSARSRKWNLARAKMLPLVWILILGSLRLLNNFFPSDVVIIVLFHPSYNLT